MERAAVSHRYSWPDFYDQPTPCPHCQGRGVRRDHRTVVLGTVVLGTVVLGTVVLGTVVLGTVVLGRYPHGDVIHRRYPCSRPAWAGERRAAPAHQSLVRTATATCRNRAGARNAIAVDSMHAPHRLWSALCFVCAKHARVRD